MPTPIIAGEKTAFINLVATINPVEATWLNTNLTNYEDIPNAIYRQCGGGVSDDFLSYPNYLEIAIAVFTDGSLVTVGIFNNKSTTNYTNPLVLINTSLSGYIHYTANTGTTLILNNSVVPTILATSTFTLTNLIVGSGSTVSFVDTNSAAHITNVKIRCLRDNGGTISEIKSTANITNALVVDSCAVFGGYGIVAGGTCALNVTDLIASSISQNSITLNWTNPANWLFNYVYFKKSTDTTYTLATDVVGQFIGDTGFIFISLDSNTTYDLAVQIKCQNGVLGTYTIIHQQTTC